jgi:electron transport complex, RnfABCDGE type, G subunit
MNLDQTSRRDIRHVITPLGILALVCASLLFIVHGFTTGKITANARAFQLRVIDTVMPLPHDNPLYDDFIEVPVTGFTGDEDKITVYRARRDGQPAGVVLMPVTAKGYSGNIQLIIGIAFDGTLLGVSAIKHRETEGLGDRIDQDKSDWIRQFTDRSLAITPVEEWEVKADGGVFDQLSGATMTSRGVVNAVRETLEYYQANRDRLYSSHPP